MIISKIIKQFNSIISSISTPINEEKLFIALAKTLNGTLVYSKSKIIHKKSVYFNSSKVFDYNASQRCELGDLRIVFFSPQKNEVRETIMQCKYERNIKAFSKFTFKCQMNQLHLLSEKLPYKEKPKQTFWNKELMKSIFETKTSYGIFYFKNGLYNLLCTSARHVAPLNLKAKSNIRKAKITCLNRLCSTNPFGSEILRTNDLNDFKVIVSDMLFGEKLYPTNSHAVISTILRMNKDTMNIIIGEIDDNILNIPRMIYNNDLSIIHDWNYKDDNIEKEYLTDLATLFVNTDKLITEDVLNR